MPEANVFQQVSVSVSDMARLVGLSRSRFHQLLKNGFFPAPALCPQSGRPFYDQAGQAACLQARRTHLGVNGKTIMFYAKRYGSHEEIKPKTRSNSLGAQRSSSARKKIAAASALDSKQKHASLIDGLKQLGLSDVSERSVAAAVNQTFPEGLEGQPHEVVLVTVFRHLVRQNSGDNVGR